ncbi:flagellar M-ring protein FliF [Virgibacillus sp. NKC19-16]|uniref:flagellar basal-body MS-ring/collar protein FliF n=1 Tax=Virgibacillus salidurans TaxID=2831673 RepID=UPI001F3AFEDB|nr:flagellar basal-body MS-ring/collar protein FliF [Virgibacillus sp. NKC19-16]UJL47934.1 flagellar M-ring protein FliF [Virgibacillus sp. NKC19-16]
MKEKMNKWKDSASTFWRERSKSQRGIFIGSVLIVIMLIAGITFFTTNSNFVPLYNNLSLQESGQIKTELDSRGVPYELEDGGTTINVPGEQVDSLLVDLAGQGIPNSGNIDYSFFSENSSWGITDNEFDVMRLDAMQTELANLMQGIEGIESAEVMINLPDEPVFASETTQEGSASIVLNTQPGYQFEGNQINALYHLVSKAVPNLPEDNIAIMNQYFEYFDRNSRNANGSQDVHTYQQTVKQDVERDIQRRLQQMLGTMVGTENVIVSVTADIDFTQENRTEELVEPVDIENMEGLPVSIETIQEAYSGNPPVGGTTGTGEEDTAGTYQEVEGEDGEYELERETINNEFNRIRKDIVESPYKIRDLGIQVAVNSVAGSNEDEVQYLTQQEANSVEDGISSILDSIVSTSINEEYSEEMGGENLSIVFQEFTGNETMPETTAIIPTWLYVTGAILLAVIIILAFLLLRRRKEEETYVEEPFTTESSPTMEVPEKSEQQDSESVMRRRDLEKMAKDKPEDFAKLLRSWIGED